MELRAGLLQIGDHRQNHGFILVVAREAQGAEVGQAADMMDIAADIELHLQRTVPVFKGEHRAPVEPEVGVQDLVAEKVGDGAVVELLVGGKEQAHDLHGPFVGEAELAVGVRVLAPILRGPHQREIGVALVQIVILIQHAELWRFDGGNGAEEIPHDLEVVVHLAPAAHHITEPGVFPAVAGAAGDGVFFKYVDAFAFHPPIAHQITGRGQRRQTRTDDVGGLLFHALGLERTDEGFVVAACVIHNAYLLA